MTHPGPHDPDDPYIDPDTGEMCFGCKVKSLRFDGSATTVGKQSRATRPPRRPDPAWERGVAGEKRADGSFMPYLDQRTLSPIGIKKFGEKRHHFEAERRAQVAPATSTS